MSGRRLTRKFLTSAFPFSAYVWVFKCLPDGLVPPFEKPSMVNTVSSKQNVLLERILRFFAGWAICSTFSKIMAKKSAAAGVSHHLPKQTLVSLQRLGGISMVCSFIQNAGERLSAV